MLTAECADIVDAPESEEDELGFCVSPNELCETARIGGWNSGC
jgi:hypothetical protein